VSADHTGTGGNTLWHGRFEGGPAAELMASVDALFAENATVISASPVRSVDEMIRDTSTARPVSHSRAVTFLSGTP
jgi:hypothetical protein